MADPRRSQEILSAALGFKSLIDSAVVFDPTGFASTAWTIVSFGLQLAQNDHERLDLLLTSSAFLANVLTQYANTESHYRDQRIGGVERLEDAVIDVYVAILEYAATVSTFQSQPSFP